jgi:hypothetical protein
MSRLEVSASVCADTWRWWSSHHCRIGFLGPRQSTGLSQRATDDRPGTHTEPVPVEPERA